MGCTQSEEDIQIGAMGMKAVTSNTQEIDNDVLDLALQGNNPNALLKSKVALTFSAERLPNLDSGSKSDPFLVLFKIQRGQKILLGRTELISDNLNPQWIQGVDVDYMFEEQQIFLVEIYDADDPKNLNNLQAQEYIGSFQFTLGSVVSSKGQELSGNLKGEKSLPDTKVIIRGEEKKSNYGANEASFYIECQVQCSGMVFVTVNRFKSQGKFLPAYRTETKPKDRTGKYTYDIVRMDTDTLCGDNDHQDICFQVFHYNSNGSHRKLS